MSAKRTYGCLRAFLFLASSAALGATGAVARGTLNRVIIEGFWLYPGLLKLLRPTSGSCLVATSQWTGADLYVSWQDSLWTVYSQCSTPQRDLSTAVASTTALLRCSTNFTGCESPSESSFDWPFSCSSAATRQHLSTWQTICSGPRMTTQECDWGRLRRTNWSCAGLVYQRPVTAPSASLRLAFGTVCRQASPQLGHCQFLRNI